MRSKQLGSSELGRGQSASLPLSARRNAIPLRRAAGADLKLCILALADVFPSSASLEARIDPLTLSLIDRNTLIVLNKIDAFSLTPDHFKAVVSVLERANKVWLGRGEANELWPMSVKAGTGFREFVEGLKVVLKHR